MGLNRKYTLVTIIIFALLHSVTTLLWGGLRGTVLRIPTLQDTIAVDSLLQDSVSLKRRNDSIVSSPQKAGLDAIVNYESNDSIVLTGDNLAFLFGKGIVTYQDIELNADFIRVNMDSSRLYATGVKDSLGVLSGKPVFKQGESPYESEAMNYSFKSQRAYITNVVTQQGEGYIVGGVTKKMENNDLYMKGCKYTTCDHHDHPHFYLNLTKAKVKPGKNIVTGPAYFVLADVPLPLAVPFAFFPFTNSYSSGVIMPTFGDEMNRGFFARDGGYYFAFNDYVDMALTGEIFTKGSWGLNAASSYRKRYKFSGNFNAGYIVTVLGDKNTPDYSKSTDFRLTWSHTQDSKSNPNLGFSASVNFSTSSFDRNNLNSYYNPNDFTQNTKSSSVSLSYRFPNSPLNLSTGLNITQRSQDSTVSVSFPDLNLSVSKIYPFKRKNPVGKERWYEKIGFSYSGSLRNSITTNETKLFKSNLVKDWKNGMQHQIPVSATFNLFKNVNVTPNFSYNEKWYTNRIEREWDTQNSVEKRDTLWGFNRVYNYNFGVSASTKLYGFYTPLPFWGKKVQTIRHVFTPSVSFSAAPDFGDPKFKFWKTYSYLDKNGVQQTREYSPYSESLFGSAPRGKQGVVSFSMQNNIEMKLNSKRDTSGVVKISLIDNFSAGISYNLAADSMNWSNITPTLRLKLFKNFTLNLNATFDTYTYKLNANEQPVRVNVTRWQKYGFPNLGRLSSTGTSFSYTFNNATFQKKDDKESTNSSSDTNADEGDYEDDELPELDNPLDVNKPNKPIDKMKAAPAGEIDDDGYLRYKFPWSFSVNYSLGLGYGQFNKTKLEYDYKLTHNLSFNGNLTPAKGWTINFSSSYDFDAKKLAYMSCSLTRDLHCWNISASFVPVGPYKSYFFTISANASLLKDLKYDKRSNPYERMNWY